MADAHVAREGAAEAAYITHYERVRRICARLVGDVDADDAAQEAFIRAAPYLNGRAGNQAAYLAQVARRVCYAELRKRGRTTPLQTEVALDTGDPAEAAVDRHVIDAALGRLSESDRAALSHAVAGFSLADVAHRMGTTVDAAAQRLSRARQRARDLIGTVRGGITVPVPLAPGARHRLRSLAGTLARESHGALGTSERLRPGGRLVGPLLATMASASLILGSPPGRTPSPANSLQQRPPAASLRPALVSLPATIRSGQRVAPGTGRPGRLPAVAHPSAQPVPRPALVDWTAGNIPFGSFTVSPSYSRDHTVFAVAASSPGTCTPPCDTLYRTTDGGRTWQGDGDVLDAAILLPPSYPSDPTVYAVGPSGLEQRDQDGQDFRRVAMVADVNNDFIHLAAFDPASSPGDERIVVATGPATLSIYSQRTGMLSGGPLLPAEVTMVTSVTGAPGVGVYVAAADASPATGGLYACPVAVQLCTRVADWNPNALPVLSPAFASDRTLFMASQEYGLDVIAGPTTRWMPSPSGVTVAAIDPDADYATSRRVVVAGSVPDAAAGSGGDLVLLESVDGGALQRSPVQLDGIPIAPETLTLLPDGRMLAALESYPGAAGNRFGLVCSDDGGASWRAAC